MRRRLIAVCLLVLASHPAAAQVPPLGTQSSFLVYLFWSQWSRDNTIALPFLQSVTSDPVAFYGAKISQAKYLQIQGKFAASWPVRQYTEQPGSVGVACNAKGNACTVTGKVDFTVSNPASKAHVSGSAEFAITVDAQNTVNGVKLVIAAQSGDSISRLGY